MHPGTPQPQMSPMPGGGAAMPDNSSGRNQFANTPSPISQTFNEAPPKKGVPVAVLGAIAVVILGIVGGVFALMKFGGAHAGVVHDQPVSSALPSATAPAASVATDTTGTPTTGTTPSAAQTASGAPATNDSAQPTVAVAGGGATQPVAGGGHTSIPKGGTLTAPATSKGAPVATDKPKGATSAATTGATAPASSGTKGRDFGF
jgi:hypothetical protein